MPRLLSLALIAMLPALLQACGESTSVGGDTPDGTPPGPGGGSCSAIPSIETGRSPTFEIHVDPLAGNDLSGGGSPAQPYASLARALLDVQPGAAVRLHPGDYAARLSIDDVSGTAALPVWIGGVPGQAKPRVVGGTEGIHLTRVRYVVLHDIEVTGATANGINCDDGGDYANPDATRYVVFRDLEIHDIGTGGNNDGLKLSGVDDYVVQDCVIERISAGSGIDHVGCHRGVIARCRFEDMGSNAIQCKGGTEDLEIRWCAFEDAGARGINIGGSTGTTFFRPPLSTTTPNVEARDVRVIANVFGNCTTPFAFVGAVDCLVAHNTFDGEYNWLFRVLQETTTGGGFVFLETQDCRLIGNIFRFVHGALSTYVNIGPNTQGNTYTISNNLWYAPDAPAQSTPTGLPATESGGIHGEEPFVGAPGPQITGASPAAGAGTTLPELLGDFAGACFADPPSIGAHEAP